MKTGKLSVIFFLRKTRSNTQGKCPIYCRATYNSERVEFSTHIMVEPKNWNHKSKTVKESDRSSDNKNSKLDLIRNKLENCYLQLRIASSEFDIEDLMDLYTGKQTKSSQRLMEYFEDYKVIQKELIGVQLKYATYQKVLQSYLHTSNFVEKQFGKRDIRMKDLRPHHIDDFEHYLKVKAKLSQFSVNKCIQIFKRVIKKALNEGLLETDPFATYRYKHSKKKIEFLTQEELTCLENKGISQARLNEVRILFVFSCYTGLAYNEIKNLKWKHIVKGFDGNLWIQMEREKTQKPLAIPLLDKPKQILKEQGLNFQKEKEKKNQLVFKVLSNQKYNSYLKEIADIVGIDKNLTTHMARRTFASTVLLYNDVPIEIVSELLGHSSIKITQESYGKIVNKQVSEHMKKLDRRLI